MKKTVTDSKKTIAGEYIGLDIGEKRIGVARINTEAKIAEPLELIRTGTQDTFKAISGLISEHQAVGIVLGLPRGLDGQETAQTVSIRDFARQLKRHSEVPVYLIDEAGTSKQAQELIAQGSKGSIDSIAAALILSDFIAQHNHTQYEVL